MSSSETTTQYPFLRRGGEMGELIRSFDWSRTTLGPPDTWPQSLRTTLSIILNSKFPMFLFWGADLLCFYNDAYRPSLGNDGKHPNALGRPAENVWPEIWPTIKPLIDQVLGGGEATWSEDQLIPIYRNGRLEDVYWTFSYSPVVDESGTPAGVFVTCVETTEKVRGFGQLQESEQRFQNLVRDASLGIIVLIGDEMQIDVVNDAYARLIDRQCDEMLGKHLFSVIPAAEAFFRPLLINVLHTGNPLYLYNQPYSIQNGQGKDISGIINVVYRPYKERDGTITGVVVICQDITEQKKAEEMQREQQQRLQQIIEQAPVATCLFAGHDMRIEIANDTMLGYWGKGSSALGQPLAVALPELVGQPFLSILDDVFVSGETYSALAAEAQLEVEGVLNTYYFDFTYKPLIDANGKVYGVMNMAIDVTERVKAEEALRQSEARYRELSASLEEQVGQRTHQLEEANQDLQRSNENLQQFAYVASHDLQEPLRKIQSFSDLLQSQYAGQLGDGLEHLRRMQSAASRMSILIRDLLTFSRISTRQNSTTPISLNAVVKIALTDLDLAIQEAGATVAVADLPSVQGDRSQLSQLFTNLLSNAIKFHQAGILPVVRVSCEHMAAATLPPGVRPARMAATFYRIDVTDNGVGFNEKYLDRIFQVFQRLHGKNQFAGTGIGLAICEKVATNHGGAITASSQPGAGATFSVYLPA